MDDNRLNEVDLLEDGDFIIEDDLHASETEVDSTESSTRVTFYCKWSRHFQH